MRKIILSMLCMLVLMGVSGCDSNNNLKENHYEPTYNDNYEGNYNNGSSEEEKPTLETLYVEKDVTKEVIGSYNNDEIKAQIKVLDVYWTTKVEPPRPTQSYYTYYEAEQDQAFQVVRMEVKNTGTESFSDYVFEGFLSDTCTPTFTYDGGYKYTGINLIELERDSSNKYDLGSFYSISPLESKTIYAIKKVPKEVTSKSLEVNLCFGDNILNINW